MYTGYNKFKREAHGRNQEDCYGKLRTYKLKPQKK